MSMSCSPAVLQDVDTPVNVSWAGVLYPFPDDWIGIYVPPGLSAADDYIGFFWTNRSATALQGFGSVQLTLPNVRSGYEFRYYRRSGYLVGSAILQVDGAYPTQAHLQLTATAGEMRVMWVSASNSTPTIRFGTSVDALSNTATGLSSTYALSELIACKNVSRATENWLDPGLIHDVLLSGLSPLTTYYYQHGSPDSWSPVLNFTTPPLVGPDSGIRVAAFGDLGTSCFEAHVFKGWCSHLMANTTLDLLRYDLPAGLDMVLHIGDISYAMGHAYLWETFFANIRPLASRVPWMVSLGNHEYDYPLQPFRPDWSNYASDSGGECGIPYSKRFHMPGSSYWWSMDLGNVHFILLSLEHDFTIGSEQWVWAQNDLSSVDRGRTPFVVAGGHRPMYSSGNYAGDYNMSLHIRAELEYLLVKFGVDLFLAGHYHNYERTCPVSRGVCVPPTTGRAPVHIVIGNAGAGPNDLWMPAPAWSVYRDGHHAGYSIIETNRTHLHFAYYTNQTPGVPADEVFIAA